MSVRVAPLCVALVLACVLLDAWAPRWSASVPVLWLDGAALVSILLAALQPGARRGPAAWETPLDGLLLGLLALASIDAVGTGSAESRAWLAHAIACSAAYVGLASLLRRDARAVEAVWVGLASLAFVLGAQAIGAAALGWPRFAEVAATTDARWFGQHTLAKALAFVTLAASGRALERGAHTGWRIAAATGAAGLGLYVARGGLGFGSAALARLDDPLYFSLLSVTLLFSGVVARSAWVLRRARRHEAMRWRFMGLAAAATGLAGVLGEGTGGEGVRALVLVAAAGIAAASETPAEAVGEALGEPAQAAPAEPADAGRLHEAA